MHTLLQTTSGIESPMGVLDWALIAAFLLGTTVVAFLTKGRQATLRDFFLSDRNLPWTVVCMSLIATEISAAGFIGVPYNAFRTGGSLVYVQLAAGAIFARFIVAHYFVPAFYERETYSPYQFVGHTMGTGAERMTSLLFMVGALLGQGVRVFVIAEILHVVAGVDVFSAIMGIGLFAALWGLIGGIRTVVWTDVVQFIVITVALLAAAVYLVIGCDGLGSILSLASETQKLHVFDFRFDLALQFTIWTGLFGATFNTMASHGADQMSAQRMFCCRGANDAKKAMIWSSLSQVLVLLMLFIGLGLFAYPRQHIFQVYNVDNSWVFPLFIAQVMPAGIKGLLIIGLMAAAISSLSSAVTALAQTTVSSFLLNRRRKEFTDEPARLRVSRLFVLFWGLFLCGMAIFFQDIRVYEDLLTLAQQTTSFTYGALLGALLVAFLPYRRDGRGILFGAPYAVLAAFGLRFSEPWTHWVVVSGVLALFICWCFALIREADDILRVGDHDQYVRRAWYILLAEFPRTIWILIASAGVLTVHFVAVDLDYMGVMGRDIAWPWYLPAGIGSTVLLSYLLSRPTALREHGT